jgi:hypothetical protein
MEELVDTVQELILIKRRKNIMKRFLTIIVLVGFTALNLGMGKSFADEIDILLQKLVEKGTLTPEEAQQIETETKEQVKKEIAEGKYSSLPAWLQNTKLKGDFRLRYAYNYPYGSNNDTAEKRGRIRFRLGLESEINDKVILGAGLATGLGSATDTGVTSKDYARSANQTLTGAFAKKPIELDYAYAKYMPKSWISLIGGKFINPFWDPEGKFIWDDNIRPEGAGVLLSKSWNSHLDTFLNTGYLVLVQNSGDHNFASMLYAFQPGIKYNFSEEMSLKGTVSYYSWPNVKGHNLPGSSYDTSNHNAYGNTRDSSGKLLYDFDSLIPQIELGFKKPLSRLNPGSIGLGFLDVPYFSIFGEYLRNNKVPTDKNNTGYVAGFKFGSETIDRWADWQFQYDFRRVEVDAIPDILPDADFYNSVAGGTTGVGGHRWVFQWGLGKNNWLAFNVYSDEKLKSPRNPETTFYADWNVKF